MKNGFWLLECSIELLANLAVVWRSDEMAFVPSTSSNSIYIHIHSFIVFVLWHGKLYAWISDLSRISNFICHLYSSNLSIPLATLRHPQLSFRVADCIRHRRLLSIDPNRQHRLKKSIYFWYSIDCNRIVLYRKIRSCTSFFMFQRSRP